MTWMMMFLGIESVFLFLSVGRLGFRVPYAGWYGATSLFLEIGGHFAKESKCK
jgi:hypothetical protein